MARKKKPPAPRSGRAWRMAAAVAVTLAVVVGAVFALGQLGDEALLRVGARDRYRTPFAGVACDTPPGLDRPTFLAEVRYVGGLPETVNAVDPAERGRVAAAFAKHPWVEAVGGVTAEPGGVVRVALRFRSPVLAVTTAEGTPRLLDHTGVLLPVGPTPPGVAELTGRVPAPRAAAGEVYDDADVRRALDLTTTYRPTRLEPVAGGWRLTLADGKQLVVAR